MTDEIVEEVKEAAAEAATCTAPCCEGGPCWTSEERAEQRRRRTESRDNSVRLLARAEAMVEDGAVEQAKVFVKIAVAWDSNGY